MVMIINEMEINRGGGLLTFGLSAHHSIEPLQCSYNVSCAKLFLYLSTLHVMAKPVYQWHKKKQLCTALCLGLDRQNKAKCYVGFLRVITTIVYTHVEWVPVTNTEHVYKNEQVYSNFIYTLCLYISCLLIYYQSICSWSVISLLTKVVNMV